MSGTTLEVYPQKVTKMVSQKQLRDEINHQLIKTLKDKQIIPWQQPWTDVESIMPTNIFTKFPYKDINPILLRIAAVKNNYTSKWWGREKQWAILGGKILPGAQGVKVLHRDGSEVKERIVYNLDCIEGRKFDSLRVTYDVKLFADATDKNGNRKWFMDGERGLANKEAERVIDATGSDFREELRDGAAYYRPPLDYIVVPKMSQFYFGPGGPASFYATAFHELAHWTEIRLDWLADPLRSVKYRYALGELRSDIASAYLCAACGVPPQTDELNFDSRTNHCRYVKHWLTMMEEDNSVIFRIAHAASEAADYILSLAGGYNALYVNSRVG